MSDIARRECSRSVKWQTHKTKHVCLFTLRDSKQCEQQPLQFSHFSNSCAILRLCECKFIPPQRQISDLPGSGVVACLCGNTTGGGQKPPPPPIGWTTLTGLDRRAATDGTNNGDAAYVSGTVLYEDRGRLSVRDGDLEPKRKERQALKIDSPYRFP